MWTNTFADALGNVKDVWSNLEQSLDAAVGQEPKVEDIAIPPPTGSLTVSTGEGATGGFLQSLVDRAPRAVTPLLPLKSPTGLLNRLLGDAEPGEAPSAAAEAEPHSTEVQAPASQLAPSAAPTEARTRPIRSSPPKRDDPSAKLKAETPSRAPKAVKLPKPSNDGWDDEGLELDDDLDMDSAQPPAQEAEAVVEKEQAPVEEAAEPQVPEVVEAEPVVAEEEEGEGEGEKEDDIVEEEADTVQQTPPEPPQERVQQEEEEPVQQVVQPEAEAPRPPVVEARPVEPRQVEARQAQAPDPAAVKSLLGEMKAQYEGQVGRLEGLLRESETRCGLLETELRKAKTIYQSDDAKQRQISALLEEGKALAYKQSEMEKAVRKARGELKGVEQERNSLQQDKEALELRVGSLAELVKRKEQENSSLTQSLAAVQAVNQASSDKLAKVEAELVRSREELSSQKAALERAWGEEKELKRMITDMTAEHGSLLNQIDGDKNLARGLEGIKQDFEQRESLLQSTNKTLQEALTRAAHEAGHREDALRQELCDMRKRWQDAVSRTETLAADMHESTAPLLRQIKALQDEARVRANAWNSAEEALTERTRGAESRARGAEEAKANALRKTEALETKIAELETQVRSLTERLETATTALKAAESSDQESRSRAASLEVEVGELKEWAKRAAKETKAAEAKLRLQLQDAQDALSSLKAEHDDDRTRHRIQVEGLRKELGDERKKGQSPYGQPYPSPRPVNDSGVLTQSSILERTIGSVPDNSRTGNSFTFSGGNGEVSVLAVEKLQQALRQREDEVAHLQHRLVDVERTRDALTSEMAALGKQATMLQASANALKGLKQQVAELSKKNDVLLELLGEKTEECEALTEELGNLKSHFRKQLDDLIERREESPSLKSAH